MKTIDLQQGSVEVEGLLNQAREDDVIVKLADGSEFLVSAVSEFAQEVANTRRNESLMKFLDNRAANRGKTIPLNEVKRRLGL